MVVALLAASAGFGARADGFLEKPGAGKVIAAMTFERASARADGGGVAPLDSYRKFGLSLDAEYGLDASTTLLARTEGGRLWGGDQQTPAAGSIGVRRLLFDAGAFRVTARGLASAGAGLDGLPQGLRHGQASLEARIAATTEFRLGATPAFVTVSAGPRLWNDGRRGGRGDLTLGARVYAPLLLLAQAFAETGEDRRRAVKGQLSAIYDLTADWSVQAGVFAALGASAERRQRGAILAAIRRF